MSEEWLQLLQFWAKLSLRVLWIHDVVEVDEQVSEIPQIWDNNPDENRSQECSSDVLDDDLGKVCAKELWVLTLGKNSHDSGVAWIEFIIAFDSLLPVESIPNPVHVEHLSLD
jgi:hypothetical protein